VGCVQANEWPKVFATSPILPQSAYIIFRGLWALIFLVHLFWHAYIYLGIQGEGWYYIMYQSRQALLLQTFAMVQQFIGALVALPKLKTNVTGKEPLWVRVAVVVDVIAQPQAFGITYVYWGFMGVMPESAWDSIEMKPVADYLDVFIHGINWVLLFVSFIFSKMPMNCLSLIPGLIWGLLYIIWTYVHYLLRLGTPNGCDEYPPELCPLYSAFDWNRPREALLFAFLAYFVTSPINIGVYMAIRSCTKRIFPEERQEESLVEERGKLMEVMQPAEPEPQKNCCFGCGR